MTNTTCSELHRKLDLLTLEMFHSRNDISTALTKYEIDGDDLEGLVDMCKHAYEVSRIMLAVQSELHKVE